MALEGLKASTKGPCFLSAEEPGSLTQEERHTLTEALLLRRTQPLPFSTQARASTRAFWTQLPTSTSRRFPSKQPGPSGMQPCLALGLWEQGFTTTSPKAQTSPAFPEA